MNRIEVYRSSGRHMYAAKLAALGVSAFPANRQLQNMMRACFWAGAFSQWYMQRVYKSDQWHLTEGTAKPISLKEARRVYDGSCNGKRYAMLSLMLQDDAERMGGGNEAGGYVKEALTPISSVLPKPISEGIEALHTEKSLEARQSVTVDITEHIKRLDVSEWSHHDVEILYDILCWNGAFIPAYYLRNEYISRSNGVACLTDLALINRLSQAAESVRETELAEILKDDKRIYLLGPGIKINPKLNKHEKVFRFNYQKSTGFVSNYSLYNPHDVMWLLSKNSNDFRDLEAAFLRKKNSRLTGIDGNHYIVPHYDDLCLFKSNNALQFALILLLSSTSARIFVDGINFFTESMPYDSVYRSGQGASSFLGRLRIPLINHDLLGQFSLAKKLTENARVELAPTVQRILTRSELEYASILQSKSFGEQ